MHLVIDLKTIFGGFRLRHSGDSRTQKVRGPRWGQGILRRGRVTKAHERKNCKFKGLLPPGLGKVGCIVYNIIYIYY